MKLSSLVQATMVSLVGATTRPASVLPRRAAICGALAVATVQPKLQPVAAVTAERVGEDGRLVLTDSTAATVDVVSAAPKVTATCYLDVGIAGAPVGRITIDVYGELAPRAAENFRALCTGEKGWGYAGSSFFKVLSGAVVQAGEVPGHGSIFGDAPFDHDNYLIKHNVAGLVSMVNTGLGGNSGQSDTRFLIQLPDDAGFLDGRYEAFGRVTAGMDVLRRIEQVKVKGTKQTPVERVSIDGAGVLL